MATSGEVLIVDDDVDVRTMLAEYLSAQGYAVVEAADGEAMRRGDRPPVCPTSSCSTSAFPARTA